MKKTKKEKIKSELEWHLKKVNPVIAEAVAKLGYTLLLLEFVHEFDSNYLRLTISHEDKLITLEDCEKVSRNIEEVLDKRNLISVQYILEVQSPGEKEISGFEKDSNYDWQNHEFSLKGLDLVVNS